MVIQVFSINKSVLETDIVKQRIASGKRELQQRRWHCQLKRLFMSRLFQLAQKATCRWVFSPFIQSVVSLFRRAACEGLRDTYLLVNML